MDKKYDRSEHSLKISELIYKLKELQKEHGDIEVFHHSSYGDMPIKTFKWVHCVIEERGMEPYTSWYVPEHIVLSA